jgi:hypothetical protein
MNAMALAKELNKRGNMTFLSKEEKMLKKDIRQLWMIGVIDGDKESHDSLGRTKYKLCEVDFDAVTCEREILYYIECHKKEQEKLEQERLKIEEQLKKTEIFDAKFLNKAIEVFKVQVLDFDKNFIERLSDSRDGDNHAIRIFRYRTADVECFVDIDCFMETTFYGDYQ